MKNSNSFPFFAPKKVRGKMTTLEALDASIAHWKRLYTGNRKDGEECFAEDCALCKKFLWTWDCEGCPIANAGFLGCKGSLYDSANKAFTKATRKLSRKGALDSEDFRCAAEDFHDWLVALRKNYVDKQGEK